MQQIQVLAVGIEKYEQSQLPDLSGPALDAAKLVAWLRRSGVPSENISLFLSPLEENRRQCEQILSGMSAASATSEKLLGYLRHELPESPASTLLIYWSGHGAMSADEDRLLFFPDGRDELQLCLNVSHLMKVLRNRHYAIHRTQHLVVDACANFTKPDPTITPLPILGDTPAHKSTRRSGQYALFSASPGEQAANIRGESSGLLTSALMAAVIRNNEWPQNPSALFKNAIEIMRDEVKKSRLVGQRAYVQLIDPESVEDKYVGAANAVDVVSRVELAIPEVPRDPRLLLNSDTTGGITRFRRKSQRALEKAGQVSAANTIAGSISFSDGLYVKRDLETVVIAELDSKRPVVAIKGMPGTGKTSLLWGIAASLLERHCEVLFVQAPWFLLHEQPQEDDVAQQLLETARLLKSENRDVVVLIDTADALIAHDMGIHILESVVSALNEEGISVVITCRPEESRTLPDFWSADVPDDLRRGLGDFSVERASDRRFSEFELAVASHAEAYRTASGYSTQFLVHQLANAVSGKQPMSTFCLRPLFLRMLFDIYAPFAVPEHLSITGLYEQYWTDRVERDFRGPGEIKNQATEDASDLVMHLGLEMLRRGSPELRLSSIGSSNTHNQGSLLLTAKSRGLIGVRDGVLTFFHQTFFEFAAAKALLRRGGGPAIGLLIDRVNADPGNYFAIAVLEQTWLCAWADESLRPSAVSYAEKVLGGGGPFVAVLRQTALRVVAQAPALTSTLWRLWSTSVQDDPHDVFAPSLRLLPTPSRAAGDGELLLCKIGMARRDEGRSAALALLAQIAEVLPQRVAALLADEAALLPEGERELEHNAIKLVTGLIASAPTDVLASLSQIVDYAFRIKKPGLIELVLNELSSQAGSHSLLVSKWCSNEFHATNAKLQRVLGHLHAQGIVVALNQGAREAVVSRFWKVVHSAIKSDAARSKNPEIDPPSLGQPELDTFAGTLLAGTHAALTDLVPEILTSLFLTGSPRIHTWLHQGLLVPILNASPPELLKWVALQMVRGLPAATSNQTSTDGRWADTLRRTLARPDVENNVLELVMQEVERLLLMLGQRGDMMWLNAEYLLDLLVRSALAGVPSAQSAMRKMETGALNLPRELRSRLGQRLRVGEGDATERAQSLSILLSFGDIPAVKSAIERTDFTVEPELSNKVQELILEKLAEPDPTRRASAWELAKAAVSRGLVPWPSLSNARSEISRSKGNPPLALVELVELGLTQREYRAADVRDLITEVLSLRKAPFHEKKESAIRRVHVRSLALSVPADQWEIVLDEVFKVPVEKLLIANAASLLVDAHRPEAPLADEEKLAVLLNVGVRSSQQGVSRAATKHGAVAWRRGISETMNRLNAAQTAQVLDHLPQMSVDFGAEVASSLNLINRWSLRHKVEEMSKDEKTDPRIRDILSVSLKHTWLAAPPRDWLTLDEDIQGLRSANGTR